MQVLCEKYSPENFPYRRGPGMGVHVPATPQGSPMKGRSLWGFRWDSFTVAVAYGERIALNCTKQGNITLYYKEFVTRELRDCILTKTESGPGA